MLFYTFFNHLESLPGEDQSIASQDEEGAIEPPRHKQSMSRGFLSKKYRKILRNDVKINPLVILAHQV
jgi:hypothetical protein